ncbi:MAG: phosphatase PAP2 family protein [Acidimicrobiales bacterium]
MTTTSQPAVDSDPTELEGSAGSIRKTKSESIAVRLREQITRLRTRISTGRPPIWLEATFIVWLLWIYDAINNLSPLRIAAAHSNSASFLHLERVLHLDPEEAMDHWLAGHHTLAVIVANYYDNAHFVVTLGALGILWWKRADLYRPLRNAMILANLMGMVVFWIFPSDPPRLFNPKVYIDVVALTHAFGSWHAGALATAANQLAAMPSLHMSWAVWSALVFWRMLPSRWWRNLVWLYPTMTAYAVLATGNHFLADVVAGVVNLILAVMIADWWQRRCDARKALRLGSLQLDQA